MDSMTHGSTAITARGAMDGMTHGIMATGDGLTRGITVIMAAGMDMAGTIRGITDTTAGAGECPAFTSETMLTITAATLVD